MWQVYLQVRRNTAFLHHNLSRDQSLNNQDMNIFSANTPSLVSLRWRVIWIELFDGWKMMKRIDLVMDGKLSTAY